MNDSVDVFNGIFTFMFVRDPFQRLNSAFQVKIVDQGFPQWLDAIPQKAPVEGQNTLPTFSEFVQHVIKDEEFRSDPSLR